MFTNVDCRQLGIYWFSFSSESTYQNAYIFVLRSIFLQGLKFKIFLLHELEKTSNFRCENYAAVKTVQLKMAVDGKL